MMTPYDNQICRKYLHEFIADLHKIKRSFADHVLELEVEIDKIQDRIIDLEYQDDEPEPDVEEIKHKEHGNQAD